MNDPDWLRTKSQCKATRLAAHQESEIPRACPVESHVCSYQNPQTKGFGCHGLARGASRFLLFSAEREPPRPKAVASSRLLETVGVATSVNLHGTSPWHPVGCLRPSV